MKRISILLLVSLSGFAASCGLLKDQTDVSYNEEISFDFTINADQMCGSECQSHGSKKAPKDVELQPIHFDKDIDISDREDLSDAAGRLKKATVKKITYEVTDNSLNFRTPNIDLRMGPKSASKKGDPGTFKLTTIPPVAPMANESGTADVTGAAESKASDLFLKLKWSSIPYGQKTIEKGEPLPPKGTAKVKMTMHVKFVANAVDAATK